MIFWQGFNVELTDSPRDLCRIELHRVLLLLEVGNYPSFRNAKHCGNSSDRHRHQSSHRAVVIRPTPPVRTGSNGTGAHAIKPLD
jgi:hypothetical protein